VSSLAGRLAAFFAEDSEGNLVDHRGNASDGLVRECEPMLLAVLLDTGAGRDR